MRIISGQLKGKSIDFLKSSTTRPLKDSVKENIFNVISHSKLISVNLKNSNILDLYSGIGSFGIECISREAKKITFVEKDKSAINVLKKNFLLLSIEDKALVVSNKIEKFLEEKKTNKFEIIFLDPPFAENSYINILKLISGKKLYQKNHIIILHREKNSSEYLEDIMKTLLVKNYGRSKIIFGTFLS